MKTLDIVLLTGISGSGKSVALNALEDAGYFCVDNLPPELLRGMIELEVQRDPDRRRRVAVSVDVSRLVTSSITCCSCRVGRMRAPAEGR